MCVFPCWPLATASKKGAKIYHKPMFEKFVMNIKPTYLHSCKLALHVSRVEKIWTKLLDKVDETLIWARRTKTLTTARKSILNLVKLQSLVAKCVKMRKIWHFKFCKFCILLYCVQKFAPLSAQKRKWCKLLHVIQKYTEYVKFAQLLFAILLTLP